MPADPVSKCDILVFSSPEHLKNTLRIALVSHHLNRFADYDW